MYELVTGKHPFYQKGDTKEVLTEKLRDLKPFTYPSHVSKEAKHLIETLTQKQ